MFNPKNLKTINYNTKKIEGGGEGKLELPEIITDENNIEIMNMKDLFIYINDYMENKFQEDLVGRSSVPFTSKGKNRLAEMMAVFAMESYSNIDNEGNVVDVLNKPLNVNANLVNENNNSHTVFQIDLNFALPYVLMAMEPSKYKEQLYLAWKDGTHNQLAEQIFADEKVQSRVYQFLKDPTNIDQHLSIAATLWNDKELSTKHNDGAKSWNAYNDYNNKTKDEEWLKDYENYRNINYETQMNLDMEILQRNTQRRREDFDDLKQFLNMPKLGATMEEAIANLVSIYEEALYKKQIPEEAAPVDNLKELGKMFKR